MPAPTSAERGREIRQRLMRVAAELIAERGWAGVSTRALAERAAITPGLVHYHFASLPALLAEAAVVAIRIMVGEFRTCVETARTPDDLLELMLASVEEFTDHDETSRLVCETYLAASRDERLRRTLDDILAGLRRLITGRLGEHGVDAPDDTAAVLVAAVDGVLLHRAMGARLTKESVAPVLRRLLRRTS